jgi:hypothetical protein
MGDRLCRSDQARLLHLKTEVNEEMGSEKRCGVRRLCFRVWRGRSEDGSESYFDVDEFRGTIGVSRRGLFVFIITNILSRLAVVV